MVLLVRRNFEGFCKSFGGSKLEETITKAKDIKGGSVKLLRENATILKKPPPKLRDPGSFAIPCVIRSETIDKALCDLGASVSLLPLSFFKRIGIGELKPSEMTLKLADRSII